MQALTTYQIHKLGEILLASPSLQKALDIYKEEGKLWLGAERVGAFYTLLVGALLQTMDRCILITPTILEGRKLYEELEKIGVRVHFLPPKDEELLEEEVLHWRINALEELKEKRGKIIVPLPALGERIEGRERMELREKMELPFEDLISTLVDFGYERVEMVEAPGEFAVRGGIIDIFPPHLSQPIRLVFFGDLIEEIKQFDSLTQRSFKRIETQFLFSLVSQDRGESLKDKIVDFPKIVWGLTPQDLELEGKVIFLSPRSPYINIEVMSPPSFKGQLSLLVEDVKAREAVGWTTVICAEKGYRVGDYLRQEGVSVWEFREHGEILPKEGVNLLFLGLGGGFLLPEIKFCLLTDEEILGIRKAWRPKRIFPARETAPISSITDMKIGDPVVHPRHGIGSFQGVKSLKVEGVVKDYISLEYAGGTKLYIPVEEVRLLHRYIGEERPQLSRLGTGEWERIRRKAKESALKLAKELITLYAKREIEGGIRFSPDTPWQMELEASFPYEETEDQRRAIEEVKRDMESPRPMDRLICGDAGFGKTEVALRAAFKAVMDGYQVAVLVPTTVLAQQHYYVFKERLAPFPIRIEMLSRFTERSLQRRIIEDLAKGTVDIVIGTHRLLSKDVKFRRPGLVIIDEEQRFGVMQKETLKKIRANVDILTLTATPIPRTLNMALSHLKDISVINDPPEGRLPIKTIVAKKSDEIIKTALERELGRGGQAFFVHNRIEDIYEVAQRLKGLVPQARIGVVHGELSERELERRMLDFYEGKIDVLVATTIIENGLDVPNANTIIIDDAPSFGLGQLYQLRGRVGRSYRQAFAYLLYEPHKLTTKEAKERLQAIEEFSHLGSGLRLALRDLEIRGAGNLLGPQQHGHIKAVGFDLYLSLLDEAIRELRKEEKEKVGQPPHLPPANERKEELPLPVVDVPVNAYIPEDYIKSPAMRLDFYRRIADCKTREELAELREEMEDRFGKIPRETMNIFRVMNLRLLAREARLYSVQYRRGKVYIRSYKEIGKELAKKIGGGRWASGRLIVEANIWREEDILQYLERLLQKLRDSQNKSV